MTEKTLTQQTYENHDRNTERARQLQVSAGTQNLLIELLDRLDQLERKIEIMWHYEQGTYRELYQLKEQLHDIGLKLSGENAFEEKDS